MRVFERISINFAVKKYTKLVLIFEDTYAIMKKMKRRVAEKWPANENSTDVKSAEISLDSYIAEGDSSSAAANRWNL
jgi:hypothetical protein